MPFFSDALQSTRYKEVGVSEVDTKLGVVLRHAGDWSGCRRKMNSVGKFE